MTGIGLEYAAPRRGPLRRSIAAAASTGSGFAITAIDAAPVAEWAALAERAAVDNIFFAPEFILPLARHLGGAISLATVRLGGRLIAAAPIARARLGRLAPAVRLFANDYAPLGAPLVDRDYVVTAAVGLIEGATAGGRSLVVPDMPLDGPLAEAFAKAARDARRPVTVVGAHQRGALDQTGAGAVAPREGLSARRRREYRRQMLRLADHGVVKFETAQSVDAVTKAFEAFLTLEAAGWKGRRGSALLSDNATAMFARAAVAALAAVGRARIDAIRLAGRPVAMLVTLMAGSTAYSWKIAYDETFARFSPGAQLMLEAGRALLADGPATRIDSCAVADHPMVDHVWKDRVAIGTMIIGPPGGGIIHNAGVAAAKAELSARGLVRRLKQRL
jgi:CelD/BcsL family acetyltransferase involved in cellulose biosynthesis